MEDCIREGCKHSYYDHIGWRAEWDKKTNCRVVGCECHDYSRASDWIVRMADPLVAPPRPGDDNYFDYLQQLITDMMTGKILKKGLR